MEKPKEETEINFKSFLTDEDDLKFFNEMTAEEIIESGKKTLKEMFESPYFKELTKVNKDVKILEL